MTKTTKTHKNCMGFFRDGVIFFPEFCKVILRKFREDNVEVFGPYMFKVRKIITSWRKIFTCSTKYPNMFKKINIQEKYAWGKYWHAQKNIYLFKKNIFMFKKIYSCLRKYLHVKGKKYMFKVRNIFQGANILLVQFALKQIIRQKFLNGQTLQNFCSMTFILDIIAFPSHLAKKIPISDNVWKWALWEFCKDSNVRQKPPGST